MKDVRGVAVTRANERKDGRTDRRTHTRTDEGHFYSPPPPMSGDKDLDATILSGITLRTYARQIKQLTSNFDVTFELT